MTPELRSRFDALLTKAVAALPKAIGDVIEEVPLIVDDRPDAELLAQLIRDGLVDPISIDGEDDLPLGLHSGVAITEQSVLDSAVLPPQIHLFREAIVEFAGGWDQPDADEEIYEEIRITLLHEIGHHFGLDENDLDSLGYA